MAIFIVALSSQDKDSGFLGHPPADEV